MHVIPKLDSLTRDSHLDGRFVLNESKMESLFPGRGPKRGQHPVNSGKTDFTEVQPARGGYKYLLVFNRSLSGWAKACPTQLKLPKWLAKKLLQELVPDLASP